MNMRKILIMRDGKKFHLKNTNQDLHTEFGVIRKEVIKKAKNGEPLKSNTGKEFFAINPAFIDFYRRIKRDAQIIPLKDVGRIITEVGINKKSRILDAGSGSGALACFLGGIAKEVVTYEIRKDFIEIVNSNIELLGLGNVKVKNIDIYQNVEEKGMDIVTLDLPEPWNALKSCSAALKAGGFVISYSPSVPQFMDFVSAIRKDEKFAYIKTVEIIEREWEVDERRVRPKNTGIFHSGFLSFARKIW